MDPLLAIRPFAMTDLGTGSFCVTTRHTYWVTSNVRITRALNALRSEDTRPKPASCILALLSNDLDEANELFSLLKEELKLFDVVIATPPIKEICLITDNDHISTMIHAHISSITDIQVSRQSKLDSVPPTADVVIAVFSLYAPSLVDRLYSLPANIDRLYLVSYVQEQTLIVDCLNDSRKTMPCHMCGRLYRAERRSSFTANTAPTSVFQCVSELEELLNDCVSSFPILPTQEGLIAFHVASSARDVVDGSGPLPLHQRFNVSKAIDLSTGAHAVTPVAFHPLCGCWNTAPK